jgi:soluble lytic murein transglycosylase-like protein
MNTIALYFLLSTAQYGLPSGLLESLCYVESTHKIDVIHRNDGNGNSVGICQIKLKTAKHLGFKGTEAELMDPEINITYAAKYLKHQINRYRSIKRGVIAYNRGNAKGLTVTNYQVKVYKEWRKHEGERSIASSAQ